MIIVIALNLRSVWHSIKEIVHSQKMNKIRRALLNILDVVSSRRAKQTILIVDAKESILKMTSDILLNEGYDVLTTFSGEESLKILEENRIDLVILDLLISEPSGIFVCRKIREKYSIINLPILISTVDNNNDKLDLAMKSGANDFTFKPFSKTELISRVKALIGLKSQDTDVSEMIQNVKVRTLTTLNSLTEDAVKSELAFLQAQIRPHFIYNALNTITSFCYTDSEKAAELLVNFSKYLRLTFDIDNKLTLIPLKREMELIQAYAEIEKARFGEKVKLVYDVAPVLMNTEIPPFCIQPLVENSIKHGLCKKKEGGVVYISAEEKNGVFVIEVRDTGIGMSPEKVQLLKNTEYIDGVGFSNVSRRIRGWRSSQLEVQSSEGYGTIVTITVA
jgi:DNA-binding response OmpR family regulator